VLVNASTPPLGVLGALSLRARRVLFRSIDAWTFVDAAAAAAWEPLVTDGAPGLVAGNPRVDRALQRVDRALGEGRARTRLGHWRKRSACLVAGSTWDRDEELLLEAWERLGGDAGSLVIVPHEPTLDHLEKLERRLARAARSYVRFSELEAPSEAEVLLVDQRGFLAEIYALGDLAYVGGGFGRQIHSIIEPVAHGLPVAFGPRFDRSPEAVTLRAAGVAFSTRSAEALADWVRRMRAWGPERMRADENLKVFLRIHRGAGERVADFLLVPEIRVS
jgi:3-deoxy-D-manno-octulosonic-acid transferase